MKRMDEKLLSQVSVIGELPVIMDCDCATFFNVKKEEILKVINENRKSFGPKDVISMQNENAKKCMERFKRFQDMAPEDRPKYAFSGVGFLTLATLLQSDEATAMTRVLIETYAKIIDLRFVIGEMASETNDDFQREKYINRSATLINELFGDDGANGIPSVTFRVREHPSEGTKEDSLKEEIARLKEELDKLKQENKSN